MYEIKINEIEIDGKKIDTSDLEDKLATLTGRDFEQCEKAERATGNLTPDVSFTKSFQARLAAIALKVNPHDIKGLPINQFVSITTRTSNFLLDTLAQEIQLRNSAV